jgi:hypothetical protein
MVTTTRRTPKPKKFGKRRRKAGQPDWDSRYADNWRKICAIAHQATGGICCCCLVAKSTNVHHLYYRDKRGAIAGREIAGKSVVPLCSACHDRSHRKDVWVYDRINPLLGNHQRSGWARKLRLGYRLLSSAIR